NLEDSSLHRSPEGLQIPVGARRRARCHRRPLAAPWARKLLLLVAAQPSEFRPATSVRNPIGILHSPPAACSRREWREMHNSPAAPEFHLGSARNCWVAVRYYCV